MVGVLDDYNLIKDIVYTNSNLTVQPVWTRTKVKRKFSTHMVWYAQNVIPLIYRQAMTGYAPLFNHVAVDNHWVWTSEFELYLNKLNIHGVVHAVGAIVWHLPGGYSYVDNSNQYELSSTDQKHFNIVLFDVTPVNNSVAEKIGLINNYYTSNNMQQFIVDTIDAIQKVEDELDIKCQIYLKTKRGYNQGHESEYLNLIANLDEEGVISIIPFQTNMYHLIKNTTLSIVVPNSSPALLAAEVGKPSIYFDPSQQLLSTNERHPLIFFSSGKEELYKKLLYIIETDSISI